MIVAVKGEPRANVMVYLMFACRVATTPVPPVPPLMRATSWPEVVPVLRRHMFPAAVPGSMP